ncbi:G-box-binding factor 1 [Brachypodium distachyon]|uniref:G-box-binding factor 1 n=1 Tax=Brachypodium distachyon TaxID=15368 RepID=UPI00052FF974|nr:G-box-binding factor 1 [Brachypodium distachyon]|eukprot:XP_010237936.1 G-box-binding factor 1 [Brachypodium distachyon]
MTDCDGQQMQMQQQCRRQGVAVDVELHAAMALADMAGANARSTAATEAHQAMATAAEEQEEEEEDLASTRLSLELGNVGINNQYSSASPCSSSSSAGAQHHNSIQAASALPAGGSSYGVGGGLRARQPLTEAEKEAKRLRRVLANRESARQTILRRQAIRDELARKVADLATQNENMKKEKDIVLEQYLTLKETNKQLKQQAHHLSLSSY